MSPWLIDRIELFLNLLDRKKHYPYVLRLSHCSSRDEIKQVIFGAAYGNVWF
ncbi:MAG: hypothetical protein ACOY46_03000 [Bacillota bacterium]